MLFANKAKSQMNITTRYYLELAYEYAEQGQCYMREDRVIALAEELWRRECEFIIDSDFDRLIVDPKYANLGNLYHWLLDIVADITGSEVSHYLRNYDPEELHYTCVHYLACCRLWRDQNRYDLFFECFNDEALHWWESKPRVYQIPQTVGKQMSFL